MAREKLFTKVFYASIMAAEKPAARYLLDHRHAAIHMERLASHIGGFGAGQEKSSCRNVIGCAQPAGRYLGDDRLFLLVIERVGHRRRNEAGRYAVHRHIAAR